jgi:glycosyltransferase involved in cell wall biosynthesis
MEGSVSATHAGRNLAFVTYYDARDVRSWSGTPYYLSRALQQQGVSVDFVGPLCEKYILPFRLRSLLQRRLGCKAYLWDREPLVLEAIARAAGRRLENSAAHVVLSPGTTAVARLKCKQPIVFWTDMTFPASLDFYFPKHLVSARSLHAGFAMEKSAVERTELAIFSSEWARQSLLENYRVDPSKVITIPFGANLEWDLSDAEVAGWIAGRSREVCELAFVGVNWERKGGQIALDVARILNERGLRTRLSIVGCAPPGPVPEYVAVHPFLNKSEPVGMALFQKLLAQAHFLILPTRADCTPLVIHEANVAGVPALATSVGGVPSQIRNGVNGQMFPLEAEPEQWAAWIENIFPDASAYAQLAQGAHREYGSRMTWEASIATFLDAMTARGLL